VVADPTSTLALECALRRRELIRSEPTNAAPVHLACSHRVVRTQRYKTPDALPHFRLFSLCSAGRNTGRLRFDVHAVAEHIRSYLKSVGAFLGPQVTLRVSIVDLSSNPRNDAIFGVLSETLSREFGKVAIGLEKAHTEKQYYNELQFRIHATPTGGRETELVEGGDTDWTQKLLNNAKERLVISGIGSERLCSIRELTH